MHKIHAYFPKMLVSHKTFAKKVTIRHSLCARPNDFKINIVYTLLPSPNHNIESISQVYHFFQFRLKALSMSRTTANYDKCRKYFQYNSRARTITTLLTTLYTIERFVANALFLCSLKASENLTVLDVFR